MLINLDQSVDYSFLEAVLSAIGFGGNFCSWICLFYASPEVMGLDQNPALCLGQFINIVCSVVHTYFGIFPSKFEDEPYAVLHPNMSARNSAYSNDLSVLVRNSAEVAEISKEIELYEGISGAKINSGSR